MCLAFYSYSYIVRRAIKACEPLSEFWVIEDYLGEYSRAPGYYKLGVNFKQYVAHMSSNIKLKPDLRLYTGYNQSCTIFMRCSSQRFIYEPRLPPAGLQPIGMPQSTFSVNPAVVYISG